MAAASPASGGEKGIIAAYLVGTEIMIPAALNRGSFRLVGRCLQVVVNNVAYTPAVAGPVKERSGGLRIGPQLVKMDKVYILEGGPVSDSDPGIRAGQAMQQGCVDRIYAMARVAETSVRPL